MVFNNEQRIHDRLVQELHAHLKSTTGDRHNILQITVNGSSGKGIASDQSDFDVKVILIHSQKDYLLQKVKESWHSTFTFDYENDNAATTTIEVDAMFIDYLRMTKYIVRSDMTAYEVFSGDIIFDSPESKAMNELWQQAYLPGILAGQYSGLLYSYLKKPRNVKKAGETNGARSNKIAFEAVYLELKLRFIETHEDSKVPPFKATELIQRSDITETEREWANELLVARRQNKNGDLDSRHNETFESFVRHNNTPVKINWDADKEKRARTQERLEELFLETIVEKR